MNELTKDKQCQIQNRYFIWQLSVLGSFWFDYHINASQSSDSPHWAAEWQQEVTNNSCQKIWTLYKMERFIPATVTNMGQEQCRERQCVCVCVCRRVSVCACVRACV
jgi:hypothetical protein